MPKKTKRKAPRRATTFRDRIVGLIWAAPSRMQQHAENWREHEATQRGAFRSVLAEIGIADAVVAFIADDAARTEMLALPTREERAAWLASYSGKLTLIDGHLRREMLAQAIPTLVLDVSPDEARKALASHDAITALATVRPETLRALADRARFEDPTINAALESSLSRYAVQLPSPVPAKMPRSLAEVVDVSDAPAEFFVSVRGPVPTQPDVLDKLRAALRKIPGVKVQVGLVGS